MITTTAGAKASPSIMGAGLMASIAQDPNFWVLFATAVIVSTMSFYYDLLSSKDETTKRAAFSSWTKYIIGGQALMFLTFYGLSKWVPLEHQLPDTVWYMLSIVSAGYSTNILAWSGQFLPSVAEKFRDKVVK